MLRGRFAIAVVYAGLTVTILVMGLLVTVVSTLFSSHA